MPSPTKEALAAAAARYHQPRLPAPTNLPPTISRDAVEAMSATYAEPEWLRAQRLAAWERYEALPMPKLSRGIGNWWNVDISDVKLDTLAPYAPAPAGEATALPALSTSEEHSGLLIQRNSQAVYAHLSQAASDQGVIFTDLATAIRDYPDLVQPHLFAQVAPDTDKLTALNAALWNTGLFLYVPKNVALAVPLHALTWVDGAGAAIFGHTLIVAERFAEVRLVEEYRSGTGDGLSPVAETKGQPTTLFHGVVEIAAAEGAKVEYFTIENWGPEVFSFNQRKADVRQNAKMHWVFGVLGGRVVRSHVDTELAAPGAETQTRGIYLSGTHQAFDLTSLTHHIAENCLGDILFKGALRDDSRAGFAGMIRVEHGAQQTNSYLSDHILFLSDRAKADSVPGLEILANDVKCSHGATIGMIDEDQVFYLMSRGLPRIEAEKLIVGGFFEEVLLEMPLESMREFVREFILAKVALPSDGAAAPGWAGRTFDYTRLEQAERAGDGA
jgi:Fe-S cluster assembly protein SufD